MKFQIFCVLAYFICIEGITQELPPTQDFLPTEYKAGNQNWSISQSSDGLIYVANNEGLLEFNGARWTLYPSPNQTIMRSVKVVDERIYTGSYMEFGYWIKDQKGILKYTSLSNEVDLDLVEDEEFWKIEKIDEWLVFQSLNRIYIFSPEDESINIIESDQSIIDIYPIDGNLYFQQFNKGIYELKNGSELLLSNDEAFSEDEVINIFTSTDDLIVLTKSNGFFSLSNGNVLKLSSDLDAISNLRIYCAIRLSNGFYAIGTIAHGLIILDNDLDEIYQINQSNGLLNNTVLDLYQDESESLWVGLDNGINTIEITSPIGVYTDQKGILGSVYATAIIDNKLFLGTNQGLFFKSIFDKTDFNFIEGTQGQVWHLSVIDNTLFVGHHNGTFIVDAKNEASQISDTQGTWNIRSIDKNLILQGNYDGLYVLSKESGSWKIRNKIQGFNNSARHFELLNDKVIVNHEYKGVFILQVDRSFDEVLSTQKDDLVNGHNSGLVRYGDQVFYASENGIFEYDNSTIGFKKDSILSTVYTNQEYISGKIVSNIESNELWIFSSDKITKVSSGKLSKLPNFQHYPLNQDVRRSVVEHENIIPYDGNNKYLIGTSFGYLILDFDKIKFEDFQVEISTINKGINPDHSSSQFYIDKNTVGEFENKANLNFSFHTPSYFKYFAPFYRYQLKGEYNEWSEWSDESYIIFENIPPGDYLFKVQSKIGDTLSENEATFEFTVSKPWYATSFMIFIYISCVIGFSIFMHHVYKRYYKKQQEKLIEENQRELKLSKLETEKQLIKYKNEQLKKEYKDKSSELAASTMSIIRKNELLTQVKEQLAEVEDKDAIKPVIRIIDKNLNHTGNWELFKEAFNNADSEFLKNLKTQHPKLSPNDLKLCAYLRLNLSSKEVAQLINISPRSVEVKRYRLRKKLNLSSDANLTDYILSI